MISKFGMFACHCLAFAKDICRQILALFRTLKESGQVYAEFNNARYQQIEPTFSRGLHGYQCEFNFVTPADMELDEEEWEN